MTITLDVPTAASIALGAYERLKELRAEIVRQMPLFPIAMVDELPTYALAAWYAHLLSLPPGTNGTESKKLLDEAGPLRESLLVAAEALAHRGLLDAGRVAEIRAGQGNIDRANDLVALAALFGQSWAEVGTKTAVERAEVDRAAALGPTLLIALGVKGLAERHTTTPESRDLRIRAFTLLDRAYDECRRAVAFLRWHENDAEDFAPTLHQRTRAPSPKPTEPGEPVEPTKPIPPAAPA